MPQTLPPLLVPEELREDAPFPEADEPRRPRLKIRVVVFVPALMIAALLTSMLARGETDPLRASALLGGPPRAGAPTSLHLAGAMAVARNGELYVADVANTGAAASALNEDRVLVRRRNGHFRVVVSGLTDISDLAFAPDGSLYIADAGWVREVGRNGRIATIAGDGRSPIRSRSTGASRNIRAGTRALSAPLGSIQSTRDRDNPLHIAFGPEGQLYIATDTQIFRLTARGTLDPVRATVAPMRGLPGGQLNGIGPIAIAADGIIYVGGNMRGWSQWAVNPDGTAHYVAYARQIGGNNVVVQPGTNGAVYSANGGAIQVFSNGKPKTVFEFSHKINNEYFSLTNFAIAPSGVTYADDLPGNYGFQAHQQLVAVHNRRVTLLWQERNRAR